MENGTWKKEHGKRAHLSHMVTFTSFSVLTKNRNKAACFSISSKCYKFNTWENGSKLQTHNVL